MSWETGNTGWGGGASGATAGGNEWGKGESADAGFGNDNFGDTADEGDDSGGRRVMKAALEVQEIDRSHYPDMTTDEAWVMIKKAVVEHDIDDLKEAIQIYVKAAPETTYVELEEAFRSQDLPVWLIAIEKSTMASTMTNRDLQGKCEKKHTVTYRFQWNPPRPRDREVWPKDETENLDRLQNAGEVVPRGVPKCRNCEELGHIAKDCPEEKREPEVLRDIKCYNCDAFGHRIRDCPTPRVDKFACKNCGKPGHKVADCTEPRSAEGVECRKCNEMGHFSKDCPTAGPRGCRNCGQESHVAKECTEPRNMANVQCRNCDEMGHVGKDCPKPRDTTRVKCSNCQQMGHYKSRCPNSTVKEDSGDAGDAGFGNDFGEAADGDSADAGGGDWNAGGGGYGGGDW